MAENVILAEQELDFNGGVHTRYEYLDFDKDTELIVSWDGTEWGVFPQDMGGPYLIGNAALIGAGDDTGEPFAIASISAELAGNDTGITQITAEDNTATSHTIAIYQIVADEPQEEVGIVIKNYSGTPIEYKGVDKVMFNTADGGKRVYSKGEAVENVQIELDFSSGDQTFKAAGGTLAKSAVIKKPDTLVAENIVKDVEIAGIVGTHAGGGDTSPTIGGITKAITFYDVEGNIAYSYTRAEAALLTELPPVPTLGNLDGSWSHTLADVKSAKSFLNVGAVYRKNGNSAVVAIVQLKGVPITHTFNLYPYSAATINVYNGVDSDVILSTKTLSSRGLMTFTLAVGGTFNIGKRYYVFELAGNKTCYFGSYTSTYKPFFGTSTSKSSADETSGLLAVTATSNFRCGQYAFRNDYWLKYICCMSSSFYAQYSPSYCYALQTIVNSNSSLANYCFQYCYNIDRIHVSSSGSNGTGKMELSYNAKEMNINGISNGLYISYLTRVYNIIIYSAPETPVSKSLPSEMSDKTIYLPDELVDTYKESWSSVADNIKPLSSYMDF